MRGDILKELRQNNKLSVDELAEKICVSSSLLQSWEQGWYLILPSSGEISEMADIFDIDEDTLREILDIDENGDYDPNKKISFIDYVDSAVRTLQFIKKHNK